MSVIDFLLRRKVERVAAAETTLADLAIKPRLVRVSETIPGAKLDARLIQTLTESEPVTPRALKKAFGEAVLRAVLKDGAP